MGPTHLDKSLRYLALCGDDELYKNVEREKPLFMTHMERLQSIHNFVKHNNNIGNIVLINDTNIIYDGQHRAACLLYEKGNINVKVKRFYFKTYRLNYQIKSPLYCKIRNLIRNTKILLSFCKSVQTPQKITTIT